LAWILPWIFAIAVAAGAMLPIRQWLHLPRWNDTSSQEFETIWRPAGNLDRHRAADVIRTIDGDTFEARVHLAPGQDVTTRVRLRGIDAPELKAACPEELRLAEAATDALRGLLRQGEVAIYNIGPDKYQGRVVADVATRSTGNVSAALVGAGHARSYDGGHRAGWCGSAAP
jgi:endonuclease YncB( thermonuclease family)